MNLEIFKIKEPSGKYYRKEYLEKYHIEELKYILSYCIDKNIVDIKFKEMIYLTLNNLNCVPICKNINCQNVTKFKNSTFGYREYCSLKCSTSDIEVLKKRTETNLEKFGTKTPAESEIIKEKSKKTCQEKYGGNGPMCNKNIQEKSKKTLIENYGVDNPNKSEILSKKRVESWKKSEKSRVENFKKSSLEKYGVDHHWKNKDIHDKSVLKTKIKKDGITTSLVKDRIGNDELIDINFENDIVIAKCSQNHMYEISIWWRNNILFQRYNSQTTICTICNPVERHISGQQIGIYNFLKDNFDSEILLNYNEIINPFEVDIYLPSIRLAIEFNGLYWHSEEKRGKSYHNDKFLKSIESGIKLIQIWEDDWCNKRNIVESFLLNQLGKSSRIFARKCIIREIDSSESIKFLRENHLQGECKSSIKIGLFFNNELVSLMCFSKPRIILSQKNKYGYYELTRFCNKIGNSVIGGASKLFKYFLKKYIPIEVISYSDNCISIGNLYKELGFKFDGDTNIGYWYVINDVRDHRFNWRKSVLVKLGHDENKTEEQIMEEIGSWRIYNAGNKRWIYKNNNFQQ